MHKYTYTYDIHSIRYIMCKTSMPRMTSWHKGTKKILILPMLSQSFFHFSFLYFLLWSLDLWYVTPPKQIRKPNMWLFAVHRSNTHSNSQYIKLQQSQKRQEFNTTSATFSKPWQLQQTDPLFGTSPAYCYQGFDNPVEGKLGTVAASHFCDTLHSKERGSTSSQTLCLREAPGALGILHAMQCKSNSVWMLRRITDQTSGLWWGESTSGRQTLHLKQLKEELYTLCSYRAGLHPTVALFLVSPCAN